MVLTAVRTVRLGQCLTVEDSIQIDIFQWFGDWLLFGFLEQLLKFCFENFRFVFFGFGDLLVFFIAPSGFFVNEPHRILQLHRHLRLDGKCVVENGSLGGIDR